MRHHFVVLHNLSGYTGLGVFKRGQFHSPRLRTVPIISPGEFWHAMPFHSGGIDELYRKAVPKTHLTLHLQVIWHQTVVKLYGPSQARSRYGLASW